MNKVMNTTMNQFGSKILERNSQGEIFSQSKSRHHSQQRTAQPGSQREAKQEGLLSNELLKEFGGDAFQIKKTREGSQRFRYQSDFLQEVLLQKCDEEEARRKTYHRYVLKNNQKPLEKQNKNINRMLGYNDYTTGGTVEEEVSRIHERFKNKV